MESRAHALAAGLFLLLMGLGAALAVWYLSNNDEAGREYVLATTTEVGGLSPQAQVRYRGIRVGKVRDISIDPANGREILVRIAIPERYPVTSGTRAELGYLGVTGLALIELNDDGSDPSPLPPDARIPLRGSQFGALGGKANDTMEVLRQVLLRLQVLLDEDNLARISGTLASVQSATAHLDRTLAALPLVTQDLHETLARTQALLAPENTERISRILVQVEAASGQGEPLAKDMRALIGSLQQLATRLDGLSADAGDSLHADTLPRLHALIDEATRDTRQLKRVLAELEAAPQMLLLGRGVHAPGPGEPGFPADRQTGGIR